MASGEALRALSEFLEEVGEERGLDPDTGVPHFDHGPIILIAVRAHEYAAGVRELDSVGNQMGQNAFDGITVG